MSSPKEVEKEAPAKRLCVLKFGSSVLEREAGVSVVIWANHLMGTYITSRKVSAEGGQVSDRTRQLRDEEQQHLADEAPETQGVYYCDRHGRPVPINDAF